VDTFLAIASKREVRSYDDRPIPEDVERRILEAGRVAGSAANRQPWQFLVVDDRGLVEQLAETVYTPPTVLSAKLVVAIAVSARGPSGFDAGRAAQNMMLAGWNEGVGSCPNGVSDREGATALLRLEEDQQLVIVLTFGYPARRIDPESRTPEEWIARAKRKPFDEVVKRV
jgi:nitroreductase